MQTSHESLRLDFRLKQKHTRFNLDKKCQVIFVLQIEKSHFWYREVGVTLHRVEKNYST